VFRSVSLTALALLAAGPVRGAGVEPEAAARLTAMARTIEAAPSVAFRADVEYDVVQPSGQKLQFHYASSVQLTRPDRLHAETLREGRQRRVWIKDGTLTLLEVNDNSYGSVQGPASIDGMVDLLTTRYGLSLPLSDLLRSDVDGDLLEHAKSGILVGRADVGGRRCDHLAFEGKAVDFQIWIQAGEPAVPRKLVITYRDEPGQPQFEAELWDWTLGEGFLPDSLFEFRPPAGAERVEIAPIPVPRPPNVNAPRE
jgi:hypothetical protein